MSPSLTNSERPFLKVRARDDGVDDGVDALGHVLDQDAVPGLHGALHGRHHVAGAHAQHHEAVLALALLDPDDALELRVQHQRPALAVAQDGAVLDRGGVAGEALADPPRDLGVVDEHLEGVAEALGHRQLLVVHELDPPLDHLGAEVGGEGPRVGDKGGREEHVAREDLVVELELLDRHGPSAPPPRPGR